MELERPLQGSLVRVDDFEAWKHAHAAGRPVLVHLNADTTWLIQLPRPASSAASGRSFFNILIDPWLQGPQSDVASWFSTQWHVLPPSVSTLAELNALLGKLEGRDDKESYIDVVAISHEFTDHCHRATLLELPEDTPVFATEKAAELIRSWSHFAKVFTAPAISGEGKAWKEQLLNPEDSVPPWLRIGRVVTEGNALYYHSALLITFELDAQSQADQPHKAPDDAEAVIYSPHGIKGSDLQFLSGSGLKILALLHGLDDVRIWMTAQLNLGALNGIQAVRACGARYWIPTHDEIKKGGGLISWLLQRTTYTLQDAIQTEEKALAAEKPSSGQNATYDFVRLSAGDAMIL